MRRAEGLREYRVLTILFIATLLLLLLPVIMSVINITTTIIILNEIILLQPSLHNELVIILVHLVVHILSSILRVNETVSF